MLRSIVVSALIVVTCAFPQYYEWTRNPEASWQLIFPGTKWCGNGNVAENKTDLGRFDKVDSCCRAHDLCDDVIVSGTSDHGLYNNDFFTKLNCKCDHRFYSCLQNLKTHVGNIIGGIYFNGLRPKCFNLSYPATCTQYESGDGINPRCVKYDYYTNGNKTYQWFDNPLYLEVSDKE